MGDDVMENNKLDFRSLLRLGGALLTLLGMLAGIFMYLNTTYVSKEVYNIHVTQNTKDVTTLETRTARLIEAIEEDRERDQNEIMKAIKDGTSLPLIVRRDILLAQGDLDSQERAELNVLNQKLQELNVD